MENCLITKLKGTIDNPDLLKLGQCVFSTENTYFSGDQKLFVYWTTHPVTVSPRRGNCYVGVSLDLQNLPAPITGPTVINTTTYFSVYLPDGGEWVLDDYYHAITSQENGSIPVHIFNNLVDFTGGLTLGAGKLSSINKEQLAKVHTLMDFGFGQPAGLIDDGGDIMEYVSATTNATTVYIVTFKRPCTAEQFGAALSTTVTRFIGPRGNTQFTGTIEGLVAAQRAKGRTSGSIQWYLSSPEVPVTFDGENAGGAWDTIVWTASTITFMGKTINA